MKRKGGVAKRKRERRNKEGREGREKEKGLEKADKEEEEKRREEQQVRHLLCQLKSNMKREISCLLPTLPKLSPLQFYSFTLHSDF